MPTDSRGNHRAQHVLAMDTSTMVGSVALLTDGEVRAELGASVQARHGEVLLPHVERVLALAGVEFREVGLLAVGLGPGSFTGVRIGVATAKGLALSGGTPLVGVVSLRALARGLSAAGALAVPVVDAHKGEVYAAVYRVGARGIEEELLAPFHSAPEDAMRVLRDVVGDRDVVLCGDGCRKYDDVVRSAFGEGSIAPRAYDVPRATMIALEAITHHAMHGASHLATLEPLYVRPSDAKLPKGALPTE